MGPGHGRPLQRAHGRDVDVLLRRPLLRHSVARFQGMTVVYGHGRSTPFRMPIYVPLI